MEHYSQVRPTDCFRFTTGGDQGDSHDCLSSSVSSDLSQDRPVPMYISFTELPDEILDEISQCCAGNGTFADGHQRNFPLTLVCKRLHQHVRRRSFLPTNNAELGRPGRLMFDVLEKIQIEVDASYNRGEWVKISFLWRLPSSERLRQLTLTPQSMGDMALQRFYDYMPHKVMAIDIHLVAPSLSSAVDDPGAFQMLFSKAIDAFEWARAIANRDWPEKRHQTAIRIMFEGPQVDIGMPPFWQRKPTFFQFDAPNLSDQPFERFTPYHYEYIFTQAMHSFGDDGGRCEISSIVHDPPLQWQCTSMLEGCWEEIIRDIYTGHHGEVAIESYKYLWETSSPSMCNPSFIRHFLLEPDARGVVYDDFENNWEEVTTFRLLCLVHGCHKQLRMHLPMLIDTQSGSSGGPSDMLRLRRLKVLEKDHGADNWLSLRKISDEDCLFSPPRLCLKEVADQVSLSLYELWHPVPTERAMRCRDIRDQLCQKLVDWAPHVPHTSRQNSDEDDRLWVEGYPKGISYQIETHSTTSSYHIEGRIQMFDWSCRWQSPYGKPPWDGHDEFIRGRLWECRAFHPAIAIALGRVLWSTNLDGRKAFDVTQRVANPLDANDNDIDTPRELSDPLKERLIIRHQAAGGELLAGIPKWCLAQWDVWGSFRHWYPYGHPEIFPETPVIEIVE